MQRFHGKALQRSLQRGAHAASLGLLRHLACHMRCSAVAGRVIAPSQGGAGEDVERLAVCVGALYAAQHVAGTLRDPLPGRIGRTHQSGGDGGFAKVQPVGGLAKQAAAQRIDAHQLASKRHQVEVGLQDLVLAPAAFKPLRRHRLTKLLRHRPPTSITLEIVVEQAGELHGDGGGTARLLVPEVGPGCCRDRLPINATVLVKALVFGQHQRGSQRGGNVGQRNPAPPAHGGVGAHAVQQLAAHVQNLYI